MTPILIVTRPAAQAADFVASIRAATTAPLTILASPLLQVIPRHADVPPVAGYVFTSVNGVAQATPLALDKQQPAYCVGQKTAAAAMAAGFTTVTGPGTATGLAQHLTTLRPATPLAHIRGQHSTGDLAGVLTAAGLPCHDIISYDQQAQPLTDAAKQALNGENPVILPLFSPRTATILAGQGPFAAPLNLVCISPAACPPDLPGRQIIADSPTGAAMQKATLRCARELAADDPNA